MRESGRSGLGFYMIGIEALFLIGFMLLVVLGAQTYRNTTAQQADNSQTRALLSYLATSVHANDASGAVHIRTDGPDGAEVLVIEDGSGYAERIYNYDGWLVEDYGSVDAPYDPKDAMRIGETQTFVLEELTDGQMLRVTTDEGEILLHLNSLGGIGE